MKVYGYLLATIIITLIITLFCACSETEDFVDPVPSGQSEFMWDGRSIQLEVDNGWQLTRYNNQIAVTSISENQQYLLRWYGDMGVGEKRNGVLESRAAGENIQVFTLTSLTINAFNGSRYYISFSSGTTTGCIVMDM